MVRKYSKASAGEGRACHARDERGQAKKRPLGEAREKPQAGYRDWAIRGASGWKESTQKEKGIVTPGRTWVSAAVGISAGMGR
jgi:hypothetical protein